MLFDSHTHINNDEYTEEERLKVIAAIEASDVEYAVDAGFDLESSALAVKHSEKYSWCYALVGVHPHETDGMDEIQLEMIRALAMRKKAVAIGEIGLDFYRDISSRENQEYWFRRQIRLANQLKMPISIHDRDANGPVMEILKEEGAFKAERQSWFPLRKGPGGEALPDSRVLLHCFSGSRELAEQYIKLGATISFAGPITYKNARKRVDVVDAVPLEFMLVETDAPYLTPEPFRGHRNISPYVEYTAKKVAEIKGITYEEVARSTCINGKNFFGID